MIIATYVVQGLDQDGKVYSQVVRARTLNVNIKGLVALECQIESELMRIGKKIIEDEKSCGLNNPVIVSVSLLHI